MKNIKTALSCWIILLISLGVKAQAELTMVQPMHVVEIVEFQQELNALSALDAQNLKEDLKGLLPTMKINPSTGKIITYGATESGIQKLKLESPADFSRMLQSHPELLENIKVISIKLNNNSAQTKHAPWLSAPALQQYSFLENLKVVHIQSVEPLSQQKIRSEFAEMIRLLETKSQAKIIYETLSNPE